MGEGACPNNDRERFSNLGLTLDSTVELVDDAGVALVALVVVVVVLPAFPGLLAATVEPLVVAAILPGTRRARGISSSSPVTVAGCEASRALPLAASG